MTRRASLLLALAAALTSGATAQEPWTPERATIERYLGRPYVWGSSGMKSFDCSGFLWRVMLDNGVLTKRTTARKFYMSLPRLAKPSARSELGTIVFFDNLKHVGIVNDRETFYHAQTSVGTNLSRFDPFWRQKVCGYRAVKR